MARSGVYLSDVKRARDQLVAQGRYPSIDAIRAALGDTGSKTTIHKYLRELDSDEGAQTHNVSDAVLALASQLTAQLKSEAQAEIDAVRSQMTVLRDEHAAALSARDKDLLALGKTSAGVAEQLASSERENVALTAQLHAEQIARHTAEQHAVDLDARMADAERHQASLEDKHRHARDALEHYRSASKEQREQEQRRHEQQVQAVHAELRQVQLALSGKLEELTRLNKEAAAMAGELGANKQLLYLEKETGRALARKLEQHQETQARVAVLEAQLEDSRARAADAERAAMLSNELCNQLRQENAALDIALASAVKAAEAAEAARASEDASLSSAIEARLAKLDQAVFGAEAASETPPKQAR